MSGVLFFSSCEDGACDEYLTRSVLRTLCNQKLFVQRSTFLKKYFLLFDLLKEVGFLTMS